MLAGRLIQEAVGAVMSLKQRLDALPQGRVPGTDRLQVSGPVGGRGLVQRGQEHLFDCIRVDRHRIS